MSIENNIEEILQIVKELRNRTNFELTLTNADNEFICYMDVEHIPRIGERIFAANGKEYTVIDVIHEQESRWSGTTTKVSLKVFKVIG